jgi:PIN domain nuclease of toxin-antitoxin system
VGQIRIAHLDTNVVVKLFGGRSDEISKAACRVLDKSTPVISAAVILELELLFEMRRAVVNATTVLASLQSQLGLQVCSLPFKDIAEHSLAETWTRDPFDRLIVANAKAAGATLLTADEKILKHYPRAIW